MTSGNVVSSLAYASSSTWAPFSGTSRPTKRMYPREVRGARRPRQLGAVGDIGGWATEAPFVEALDHPRVGDGACRGARREPLGEAQVGPRARPPLGALRIEAVDIEDSRDTGQARQQ